jgi:hypothetical protein
VGTVVNPSSGGSVGGEHNHEQSNKTSDMFRPIYLKYANPPGSNNNNSSVSNNKQG